MGKIIGAYLLPHPPILLKEIGKGEERKAQKTIVGMREAAKDVKKKEPGVIVLVTPHGPVFQDAIAISAKEELKGSLANFGAGQLKYTKKNHLQLVRLISEYAKEYKIISAEIDSEMESDYAISADLDHGAIVPLYFIDEEYTDYQLVHITYGLLPAEDLYQFGMAIQKAVRDIGEDAIVIASGDLSHRLTVDAPAGYSPRGIEFDQAVMEHLENGEIEKLFELPSDLCNEAGECGLRSIQIMLGSCDGYKLNTEVLSYEGPFGVGYGVVKIHIGDKDDQRELLLEIKNKRLDRLKTIRANEDEYTKLARNALEEYVKTGKKINIPDISDKEMLEKRAGIFVSLKKGEELRGCIGTIQPTTENIASEIIRNAIQAGTQDPRFYPVIEEELEELIYSVDVLHEPESIDSFDELDAKEYGVIVQSGNKTGLLLPNLDNVNTVEEQVKIVLQKAGIRPGEKYRLQRFKVIRHC